MDMLFIGAMKYISLLSFLFVRRKILRLYRLTPLLLLTVNYMMVCTANQVETQNFASHKQ